MVVGEAPATKTIMPLMLDQINIIKVLAFREMLAELYESEKQWSKAAQMLSGIDLDSGIRIDDAKKLSKCVKIATLYLEDDDAVNADFINKASFLVGNSLQESVSLQYKMCYARILDLKRKFLEAALRYYDISQIEKHHIADQEVNADALEVTLSAAVTCTILAAAGPQRSRVLATLYKAEKIAARMIYEDRMRGSIDQVEAVIHFDDDTEELQQWDLQIMGLCQALNDILDSMARQGISIPV